MAETIEYEELEAGDEQGLATGSSDLSRLSEIPMELSVEIGRTHMTVGETLELRVGAIVQLERQSGQPVDLLVNGSPIARGEVVVVDEQYGLRITEILDERDASEPVQTPEAQSPAAPDAEPATAGSEEPAASGGEG